MTFNHDFTINLGIHWYDHGWIMNSIWVAMSKPYILKTRLDNLDISLISWEFCCQSTTRIPQIRLHFFSFPLWLLFGTLQHHWISIELYSFQALATDLRISPTFTPFWERGIWFVSFPCKQHICLRVNIESLLTHGLHKFQSQFCWLWVFYLNMGLQLYSGKLEVKSQLNYQCSWHKAAYVQIRRHIYCKPGTPEKWLEC